MEVLCVCFSSTCQPSWHEEEAITILLEIKIIMNLSYHRWLRKENKMDIFISEKILISYNWCYRASPARARLGKGIGPAKFAITFFSLY